MAYPVYEDNGGKIWGSQKAVMVGQGNMKDIIFHRLALDKHMRDNNLNRADITNLLKGAHEGNANRVQELNNILNKNQDIYNSLDPKIIATHHEIRSSELNKGYDAFQKNCKVKNFSLV